MTNEPNLADEFLNERKREPAEAGKYTTSLAPDIVVIIDRWQSGGSSRKSTAEALIRIADQYLRAKEGAGSERGASSPGAAKSAVTPGN